MSKKSVLFISSLLSTPLAYALEVPFGSFEDFGEFIGTIGQVLHSLVTNQYSSFFILAIILFILLYNIFRAPLQKIPVFEGTPGKSIAVALTLLSELGLFYKARETGIDGLLSGIFGANNLFVGIVIAVLLFLFWRKSLGNISNNKLALFFTGLSCFALDSLLQTPLMSTIGLSLIVISAIWFVGSKSRSAKGKTFTKRFKEEWKATKKLEKKEKKKQKDISKDIKNAKKETKKEIEHDKKELDIYEELVEATKKQIKSNKLYFPNLHAAQNYLSEVQSLSIQLYNSLEESIKLYTEEHSLVVDESKRLAEEKLLEKEIILHKEALKEALSIEPGLEEKQAYILQDADLSKNIVHLQKFVERYNSDQKNLLSVIVSSTQKIQKILHSIDELQKGVLQLYGANTHSPLDYSRLEMSYKETKNIGNLFSKREKAIKKKKHLLDKERKLTKLIRRLQKKEKGYIKKLGKKE